MIKALASQLRPELEEVVKKNTLAPGEAYSPAAEQVKTLPPPSKNSFTLFRGAARGACWGGCVDLWPFAAWCSVLEGIQGHQRKLPVPDRPDFPRNPGLQAWQHG